MIFEWDESKNRANVQKHGVSFIDVQGIFFDPFCFIKLDSRFSHLQDEERWQALGTINGVTVILVAYTYRDDNDQEIIRIISARKANKDEKRTYDYAKTRGY